MAHISAPPTPDVEITATHHRAGKHWITEWRPEDEDFWRETGKKVALRNLVFSVLSEHIGFSIWTVWSILVLGCMAQSRTLKDGRSFNVIKRLWSADELERYLGIRGWSARAQVTRHEMILYAAAAKS